MIKVYENGDALVGENREFLDTNRYLSCFFAIDAPLLKNPDKRNYAVGAFDGEKALLALKVEPYSMLLFGDGGLCGELFGFLLDGDYAIERFLCGEETGSAAVAALADRGIEFYEALAMDFMEADTVTEPSSNDVLIPTEDDVFELYELKRSFISDCGLADKTSEESIKKSLGGFRIIRADGKIVSMARIAHDTDKSRKISDVYTRPEYRGKGYARKVVNFAKNEIILNEKIATLNVDKSNPISNRLYLSLGFKKAFSQGEYRRK